MRLVRAISAGTAAALAGSLLGCSQLRAAATGACPGPRPTTLVMVDGSATQAGDTAVAEQVDLVASIARQASEACGRLRVERFRGSASDVDTVIDADLTPPGATGATRDRNRDKVVEGVRATVERALAGSPARGGSDPLGAITRGARLLAQDRHRGRRLIVVTDGVQSHDPDLATPDLSPATAARFLDAAGPLPDLSGIDVVVTGVGRVAGAKPPTSYVNGLVAFYTQACERARAASCRVVDSLLLPAGRSM